MDTKEHIENIIEHLEERQLRDYLKEHLPNTTSALRESLWKFLAKKAYEHIATEVEPLVSTVFVFTPTLRKSPEAGTQATDEYITAICLKSEIVLICAFKYIKDDDPDTALVMGVCWMEHFVRYIKSEYLEGNFDSIMLREVCGKVREVIETAFKSPSASDWIKSTVSEKLTRLSRSESVFEGNELIDARVLAVELSLLNKDNKEALKILNTYLKDDPYNADLIIRKFKVLFKLGKRHLADGFMMQNIVSPAAMDYYIKVLFEEGNYGKVLQILGEILDPNDKGSIYTVPWLITRAKCYDALHEPAKAKDVYQQIFSITGKDESTI